MVVYRATPPDVASGVRVGDVEYPGFPASAPASTARTRRSRSRSSRCCTIRPLNTPIVGVRARRSGQRGEGDVRRQRVREAVQEEPHRDRRQVHQPRRAGDPRALAGAEDDGAAAGRRHARRRSCKINGELRKINADQIAALAAKTSPTRLWNGPFVQLGNSQVEASFADHRTYLYKGKEVDQQVHLGFDLAVTAHVPVVAANAGTVLNASWLGIYGNCVIIDHGMGVQSLYGHLIVVRRQGRRHA